MIYERHTACSANLTGSDDFGIIDVRSWQKSKDGVVPRFSRFSFVNYYWEDLHRLVLGGYVEQSRRNRIVDKSSHLVD